jgi:hypothetical protein
LNMRLDKEGKKICECMLNFALEGQPEKEL